MDFAEIILPLNLRGTFTYRVPDGISDTLEPGMRVLVPFRGKKIYTGIISHIHQQQPEAFVAREIISMLDRTPIVPRQQLEFWQWLSDYYLCNIGEVYRFAFPSSLKLESETYLRLNAGVKPDYSDLDLNETHLLQALEVRQLLNLQEIVAFVPKKDLIKTISSLVDRQMILVDEKIAEKYRVKEVAYVKIEAEHLEGNQLANILTSLNRSPKQKELFLKILEQQQSGNQPVKKSGLFEGATPAYSQLKALVSRGLVAEYFLEEDRLKNYSAPVEGIEQLSSVQQIALSEINEGFAEGKNVLLHGVTASGKTHLYLQKIEDTIAVGKNVLFLVPELSLSKQIISRLEKKFGKQLGFYHTKLSDFERVEVWRKVRNGEIRILVGTRSSLFLPFGNLGLMIVDEEHDSAYRPREVHPYFQARDAALVLAKVYGANVILGSATPSVEAWYSAARGKLKRVQLKERFGGAAIPEFEILDFGEAQKQKNTVGYFSTRAVGVITDTLASRKQVIVLHNRRGFSGVVECETCGYVAYCTNCDVVLTYHKSAHEMKCHYCGQRAAKPVSCPRCQSENLNERGVGTEQIQEQLGNIFPNHEVERMDVDSMRRKFAYEKLFDKIKSGDAEIIVGTRMISKGLDFENIETVVVPKADSMLYVQDFRAEETAFQLLTQVSGRAGRLSGSGKVLVQTYQPNHAVFKLLYEKDEAGIYSHFINERKKFLYPPFVKMIMIQLKHRKEDKTDRASQFLGSVLRKYLPAECVFGPEKAPVGKINMLYQYQIMLKLPAGKKYSIYKQYILKSLDEFREITAYQSIKVLVFVDF